MSRFYRLTILVLLSLSAGAQLPVVTIVPASTTFCTGRTVNFAVVPNEGLLSYSWSVFPTREVITSAADQSTFSVVFPRDLSYTVSLICETTSGPVQAKRIIPVSRTAKASFNASLTSVGLPNELALTNYSSYSNKNIWMFSDEEYRDSSSSTIKYYNMPGSYTVTLLSYGARGCNDTSYYDFTIEDASSITLPNVFTPNGDDVNEVLRPVMSGISGLNAYVFSREGTLIYQWNTVNGFWDGRSVSGEPCVNGSYIVVVEAWGFDGKRYRLSSNVTLVR